MTGSPTGTLGGEQLNAGDLQIATSVRLADDASRTSATAIASRPAGELAMRAVPDYPGDAPPILPPALARAAAGLRARPELADAGHTLAVVQRGERFAQPRSVGERELRVELQQRLEHKPPRASPAGAAGSGAPSGARARPAGAGRRRAGADRGAGRRAWRPRSTSIALQVSRSSSGPWSVSIADRRVQEVGPVEDLPPTGSVS